MTTIVYNHRQGTLSMDQMLELMHMYGEETIIHKWMPGDYLPPSAICFSPIDSDIACKLDVAEEDLIPIEEAMQALN